MKKWLPVLILPLVVAGCGGSDRKPVAELTGKLQGGTIQGVEWRTQTRSGVTDVNGRFAYLPGETVTFSLGDVELGAAPGSSDMTLFTLAGLTPPTTERALRRELDRAMRTSTPFTRAINLDLLLIALDADANPDNGLDMRNRASVLKGVTLEFDQRIGTFGSELYRRVPTLAQSVPLFKPVVHLYASLGLRVSVHAQARILTENPAQVSPGVRRFSYHANGLLQAEDDDRDGDGVTDSHSGYDYDGYGRQTRVEDSFDNDLDHVTDQQFSSTYQFDARGKITRFVQSSTDSFFGNLQTWTLVEHVVDDFGRTTRQVVDLDTGSDGSIESRQIGIAEYDAALNRRVFTTSEDVGNDGVADRIVRSTEIDDSKRRLLSRVTEFDNLADGVVDYRTTDIYSYDDVARTMRLVSEADVNADGTADWRSVGTWQLDRAANVTAQTTSIEPFADGVIWQAQSYAREFDAARRVTKSTRDEDYDGDGNPDARQVDVSTYNELGDVTLATSDYDADFNGQRDAHFDEGYEYGLDGEMVAGAAHYDFDGDGLTELRVGLTVENLVVDDGVLLLTNGYFRTRFSGFQ